MKFPNGKVWSVKYISFLGMQKNYNDLWNCILGMFVCFKEGNFDSPWFLVFYGWKLQISLFRYEHCLRKIDTYFVNIQNIWKDEIFPVNVKTGISVYCNLHPRIFSGILLSDKSQKKLFSDMIKHILLKNTHEICNILFKLLSLMLKGH